MVSNIDRLGVAGDLVWSLNNANARSIIDAKSGTVKHSQSLKHSMKSLSVLKLSLHKYLRVSATWIHTKISQNLMGI